MCKTQNWVAYLIHTESGCFVPPICVKKTHTLNPQEIEYLPDSIGFYFFHQFIDENGILIYEQREKVIYYWGKLLTMDQLTPNLCDEKSIQAIKETMQAKGLTHILYTRLKTFVIVEGSHFILL